MTDEPIEDRIARADPEGLDDAARLDLARELARVHSLRDPVRASRAFRWALDVRRNAGDMDGDTTTWHLARALELTPDDDQLLDEYLREVADEGYAATSPTLEDVARSPGVSAERARTLAIAHTFAELWCVEVSMSEPTPADWIQRSLRATFAAAVAHGATEADWLAFRERVPRPPPIDAFARWTRPS